jgi:hypothetical protein
MSGFKFLINLHRFFGISYFGASINKQKQSKFWRIIIIIWSFIVYSNCIKETYNTLKDNVMDRNSGHNSIIIYMVLNTAALSYFSLPILINLILLFKGDKVLRLVRNKNFLLIRVPNELNLGEKRIAILIAIIQFISHLTGLIIFKLVLYIKIDLKPTISHLIAYSMQHLALLISLSSVIAIIAYESFIIRNYLRYIKSISAPKLLPQVYHIIFEIKEHIEKLDDLFSPIIFLILMFGTIIEISSLCLLSTVTSKTYQFAVGIKLFFDYFIILIAICYVCEIIPHSIEKFVDDIEKKFGLSIATNQSMLPLINLFHYHKNDIGFTAFHLVKIRTFTLLTIASLIISYAVLLIQTSGISLA